MCGIAGILNIAGAPPSLGELRAMCDVMVHRGPDDEGFYVGYGVGLGMRRLSIISPNNGRQPVRNEDGSLQVVLNGEIYNFRDLRRQLERCGHNFYTDSDTEVIVHLYEEHGVDCVQKLRGMFAFALWDDRRKQLFVARDRLGIKPLYYVQAGGRLAFASELKALLQLPEVKRELNWNAVDHLFTFLSTPATEAIIEGVRKLEPGHLLVKAHGRDLHVSRYWDVSFQPDYGRSEEEVVEGLREHLEEAVRLRLVSDVPLGAFLSGGMDSSAVVATMARLNPEPVKTFSIGFTEPEYDEAPHARQVAEAFGSDHHELILEPDVLQIVEDMAWYLDEPFGDSSAIPTYMVSRLASEDVTVVLSGDGGDELFAGYDKYRVEERERHYRHMPALVRRTLGHMGNRMPEGMKGRNFLHHITLNGAERYLDASTLYKLDAKEKLFRSEVSEQVLKHESWRDWAAVLTEAEGHWLSSIQYLDLKRYLPLDILTKVDRMSMAHSIEARVPLLDHKLVEFAATIPPEWMLRNGSGKDIFKRALRDILPDEIIDRRKQGFAVPLARWFRGRLTSYLHDLLLSESSRNRDIFNPDYIERLIRIHNGGRNLDLHLWTLISFELWCRTFLDEPLGYVTRQRPESVLIVEASR